MTIDELCCELCRVDLGSLALVIEVAKDKRKALQEAARVAQEAGEEAIRKRNRLPGRKFLERCCLGALGHRQQELAEMATRLAEKT